MVDLATELTAFCHAKGIKRFAPSEMIELLQDGEAGSWIAEQVMPDGPDETTAELRRLLERITLDLVLPSGTESHGVAEADADAVVETVPAQAVVATDDAFVEPMEQGVDEFDARAMQGLSLPSGVDNKQVHELLNSPRGKLLADFGAFCEEMGVEANEHAMDDSMMELHEQWLQTSRATLEGARPADLLEGGRLFPQKIETYRRDGPKMGRNEPCSCGSGYKYKKCCGKAG